MERKMLFIWPGLLLWHLLCAGALFWLQRRLPADRPIASLVAGLLIWCNAGYALAYLLAICLAVRS